MAMPLSKMEETISDISNLSMSGESQRDQPSTQAPRLPRKRRRDIIPDEDTFKTIDEHALEVSWTAGVGSLQALVSDLVSAATSPVEQVRAFYVWIAHNIDYDTNGYFGRAPLQPMDAGAVLLNRVTVCEGYVRLMEALCRQVNIQVKSICGYSKAFGSAPGNDVTNDAHNAHAWNAVFLQSDWFLMDVTWGAGFVKANEKVFVKRFNNAYFLTDPDVFVTDHWPCEVKGYEHFESGSQWQLLDASLTKTEFCMALNFDQYGKEWGICAVSHPHNTIDNIDHDVEIVLAETCIEMEDYVSILYKGPQILKQTFVYVSMVTHKEVNIHVRPPEPGAYTLQIYGRRREPYDVTNQTDFQPIVKYSLHVTRAFEDAIATPYPNHHTMYGPSRDIDRYGVSNTYSDIDVYRISEEGEVTVTIKPTRDIELLPYLYFKDGKKLHNELCLVNYSPCSRYIYIHARLASVGYFKLIVFGRKPISSKYSQCIAYLIRNTTQCTKGLFPLAYKFVSEHKCCILEPLSKNLPQNTDVTIRIRSTSLVQIRCCGISLRKVDDVLFEGDVRTPLLAGSDGTMSLLVEGCTQDGGFHMLYVYSIVANPQ